MNSAMPYFFLNCSKTHPTSSRGFLAQISVSSILPGICWKVSGCLKLSGQLSEFNAELVPVAGARQRRRD